MQLLKKGDIVKVDRTFCKVTHERLYDHNFVPSVELTRKDGQVMYVPAHSVYWNGKQFLVKGFDN